MTDIYLAWLHKQVESLASTSKPAKSRPWTRCPTATQWSSPPASGSAALLGDGEVYPIRGQVVRVANPGLADWLLDDDNPAGLTYIVPCDHDVVCGGTNGINSWDETTHADIEAAILSWGEATEVTRLLSAIA